MTDNKKINKIVDIEKKSTNKGKLFGLISGSITTIGVIIGLWQSHNDMWIIISGILSIALSDSFSDGLGMYFSQRIDKSQKDSAIIGFQTLYYKILITLSFILPFTLIDIKTAIHLDILWSSILISYASYQIEENILINLVIATIVIFASYIGGNLVKILIQILSKK